MQNTYEPNSNISLNFPYAAKDSNDLLYVVLGPATMSVCNVLRVDPTAIVPLRYTNAQVNALTLMPEGVTISLKINPQFSED